MILNRSPSSIMYSVGSLPTGGPWYGISWLDWQEHGMKSSDLFLAVVILTGVESEVKSCEMEEMCCQALFPSLISSACSI